MWRGRKVCSHTIAVAERANCLQSFVQVLQNSTQVCSLTNLITTLTDRRKAGTKSGTPKNRGKGPMKTPVTTFRSRLDEVCGEEDTVVYRGKGHVKFLSGPKWVSCCVQWWLWGSLFSSQLWQGLQCGVHFQQFLHSSTLWQTVQLTFMV
jgi:hypothetical protein